jgi:hypothetical protein
MVAIIIWSETEDLIMQKYLRSCCVASEVKTTIIF